MTASKLPSDWEYQRPRGLRAPGAQYRGQVPRPAAVKNAGTRWEHWISQIDDHLKPPTVAKRCTSFKDRESPALRGLVAGRWALATTSLYPSTKIERSKTA